MTQPQATDSTSGALASDPRPAAVVAGIVFAYAVVQAVFGVLTSYEMTHPGGMYSSYSPLSSMIYFYGGQLLLTTLPLAIGVFLSLWLLLPLSVRAGLGRTLLSALVATAVGIVIVLIVTVVQTMAVYNPVMNPTSGGGVRQLAEMLTNGITTVLFRVSWDQFALVAAACLGTWGWMQSRELRRIGPAL